MGISMQRGISGLLVCGLGMLLLFGCGANPASDESVSQSAPAAAVRSEASTEKVKADGAVAQSAGNEATAMPRKIIYTAEVSLIVENLTKGQQKLRDMVQKYGGYIAGSNIDGVTGAPRTGNWKVRVPVGRYDSFMKDVAALGEVQNIHTDSQDVSEEYYDLQTRIANKQVEEKRLIEHLKDSTAKLEDILKVEKEISRVRGEIEQMQGRMRLLANQTELATVTVTINEVKDYVPPAPPTFFTQIVRTFSDSFSGVIGFGEGAILLAVALTPWLVILLAIGIPLRIFLQRRARGKNPEE